ncbi:hypothetical protein JCM3770_007124 [Rhodotorula araucariae]
MEPVQVLADPSVMTVQERTHELAASIVRDDLLGVVLVLSYCGTAEISGTASPSNQTPLEVALCAPTVRTPVRRLIVECLLHRGASLDAVLRHPPANALPASLEVVTGWNAGGRERATTAYALCYTMPLEEAEPFIADNGYGPDGSVDPPLPEHVHGASSIIASSSNARLDGPAPYEASTSPTPPPAMLDHWIFVGGLPRTVAERYVYEQLSLAGIPVDDVFLSQSRDGRLRFAYVALRSGEDIQKACAVFSHLCLDGRQLRAKQFVDRKTGSHRPQLLNWDYKRQYVGPERQALRLPNYRRLGLFLLHVAPHARPSDVADFLQRSLPPDQIGAIEVRRVGMNTLAFVSLTDEELCRKAIRELDGECFLGQGVRVSWLELDRRDGAWPAGPVPARTDRSTGVSRRQHTADAVPSPEQERLATNFQQLATNRYAALAAAGAAKQLAAARAPADAAALVHQSSPLRTLNTPSATQPKAWQPVSPLVNDQITEARASSNDLMLERDVERLRSLGLAPELVEAIQQVWRPREEPPSTASSPGEMFERSIDVQVRFGFVPQEIAKKALKENKVAPTYPDDRVKQARYEAFLAAQAGESRDYYTVFFAQLAEFNFSSAACAETARCAAANSKVGMEVDESVFKTEEKAP